MSVIPVFLLILATLGDAFIPLHGQHFGLGILPPDLVNPIFAPFRAGYCRPWYRHSNDRSGNSNSGNDKDTFKVHLDVHHFNPDEIEVKVIDDYVQVVGKHDERKDEHGLVSREFVRRYPLPEGVEQDAIVSELSSDGILIISAPKMALPENGRIVPIIQMTTPALEQTNKDEKIKDEKATDGKTEVEESENGKPEDEILTSQKNVVGSKILKT